MSMSDAFLPEGGRAATPQNDPLEREDVDLGDETEDDHLSEDVSRGARGADAEPEGDAPTRAAEFRPPTGEAVDPADD
ncbi:MAG: hypothetical protein K0R60_523 [Microbacterium sp.]|jgi:hypothetical protein|nr:hypothetical protein [Microbacterium sp.]MDF2554628.1 hypothetical protein [Microbacterium sp.]